MPLQSIIKVKRCPLCGIRLVQQADGSWKCPNCSYIEPA